MRTFLANIATFLGFNRNSAYVNKYLREANVRSGVFMALVIVVLEIWLLIRQTIKYLVPLWNDAGNKFEFVFSYTSNFILFLLVGLTVFTFCLTYGSKRISDKAKIISNGIFCVLTMGYSFFVFLEAKLAFGKWNAFSSAMANVLLIIMYLFAFLTAFTILLYSFFKHYKKLELPALLNVVMILFAGMCIVFGVKVSYSDYLSKNPKEIICFLTMIIYGACLLIWRPYISIVVNAVLFIGFYYLLVNANLSSANSFFQSITGTDPSTITFLKIKADSYTGFAVGEEFSLADWTNYLILFKDGDLVNYITFFISFTMVCISLYHQRRRDAIKDEELEFRANFDELTGLHNYSYFVRNVQEIKNREGMRVLFINLDNFKTFNDQRGFPAGNNFLRNAGAIIRDHFQDQYVCRQNDDHYVAFVSDENLEDSIEDLNSKIIMMDREISLGIKVGSYHPLNTEDIRRATDKARYACQTIKNDHTKVHVEYDKKMHNEYHLMQYIIHNVDQAIEKGWVVPYYQPVVWSKDGKLCGLEALARWNDPKRGMLSPASFIPTLENTKLIHKLDACIIERVCQNIREALDTRDNKTIVPVSINFSRLDFELMDAVKVLDDIMIKYNIPKELIHVEITESALTDKDTNLFNAVHQLKEKGYALWLDDFGSGYSSLNVLKDFEFDVLKIDMKFLTGFSTNPRTKLLIESIIQMAEKLGMRTLTEGVETKEEMEFLNKVNCERLQGYLFGKPFPHEVLTEKIDNGEIIVSKKHN